MNDMPPAPSQPQRRPYQPRALLLPRWLWLNHIPQGLDLTANQKRALRARMRAMGPNEQRRYGLGRRMLANMGPGIAFAVAIFICWIVWLITAKLPPAKFVWVNVGGIIVFNVLVWIAVAYGMNRGMRPLVWRALNDIGFRVCMDCGYVLDQLPSDVPRCPECGESLHPPTVADASTGS